MYVFLKYLDSFETSLVKSVSYGGDADTIGAIVGAMSGAYHGIEGIPERSINNVEDSKNILQRADDYFNFVHGGAYREWLKVWGEFN